MFANKLNGCGFESSYSHINFRFCACFEQGVLWHADYYRAEMHSETHTWHDNNIQSDEPKVERKEITQQEEKKKFLKWKITNLEIDQHAKQIECLTTLFNRYGKETQIPKKVDQKKVD